VAVDTSAELCLGRSAEYWREVFASRESDANQKVQELSRLAAERRTKASPKKKSLAAAKKAPTKKVTFTGLTQNSQVDPAV
jgi:hypothetical protein